MQRILLYCLLVASPVLAQAQPDGLKPSKVPLVAAAEAAGWDDVSALMDAGAEVNLAQADGTTALHWAAYHNHPATAERLIQAGANVDAETTYKVTPLSLACELGHPKVVAMLVEAGSKVEVKRMGGERPLMLAARQGNLAVVRKLIEAKAKVDARESKQQTALMWAAAAGHDSVVAELLSAGAERDYALKSGFNALMFAVREGRAAAALRLIEGGADVNQTMRPKKSGGRHPRKGMSPLLMAVENGHFELAIQLVERGADPNDQRSGFTPLHALTWVRKTKRGDGVDGDPPPRGSGKMTSLEFVRALVEAGADVNQVIQRGKSPGKARLNRKLATPFLFASATCDLPLMELLLELGADATLTNADDCNALMAAAGIGVTAVGEEPGTEPEVCAAIKRLAGLGLDVNHVDKNGETAMHGAAYRTFPKAVETLAALGADPEIWNQKNTHGWTPYSIAGGKRPGSVKPSPETKRALDAAKQNATLR